MKLFFAKFDHGLHVLSIMITFTVKLQNACSTALSNIVHRTQIIMDFAQSIQEIKCLLKGVVKGSSFLLEGTTAGVENQ